MWDEKSKSNWKRMVHIKYVFKYWLEVNELEKKKLHELYAFTGQSGYCPSLFFH